MDLFAGDKHNAPIINDLVVGGSKSKSAFENNVAPRKPFYARLLSSTLRL